MKMEQPVTTSVISLTDTSARMNEIHGMLPIRDTIVPISLPSSDIVRNQPTSVKSEKHRTRFSPKLHPSEQRPDSPLENADMSHENYFHPEGHQFPSVFSRVKTKLTLHNQPSMADNKLKEIIVKFGKNPFEKVVSTETKTPFTDCLKWIDQSRRFLRDLMNQSKFHYTIITLVMIDLIVVFIEVILNKLPFLCDFYPHMSMACLTEQIIKQCNITKQPEECLLLPARPLEVGESFLYYISLIIICIFMLELLTAFFTFGWRRYTKILYFLDASIILATFILEVYFHFGGNGKFGQESAGLVILRLWKIVRVIHAVAHSISLRNHLILKEIEQARLILKEENLRAEKTIHELEIKNDHLINLLVKMGRHTTTEEIHESTRRRTKDLNSVTFF